MKRIENYRTGDRAEKLGMVLLQPLCAVAQVPREEDFGLVDAVGTLLRRDSPFVYAEDSFLLQLKSRTVKQIEYSGARFEALLSQDLPLLVAQVDLTRSSVKLHTLGVALAHPNVNDAKGLVAYLRPAKSCPFGLVDDVLHLPLRKPILQWTIREIEAHAFRDNAYLVLKEWVSIERWNRRYRRAGMARLIHWETNAVPTEGGVCQMWHPARSRETLAEVAPAVHLLASRAVDHSELRSPMRAIFSWLRQHGVEADPRGTLATMFDTNDAQDRLRSALAANPGADVAVTFRVAEVRPDFLAFWLFDQDRKGTWTGSRHAGSLQAIRELGFEAGVEVTGDQATVTVGLSDAWLDNHHLAQANPPILETPSQEQGASAVFLLRRRAEPSAATSGTAAGTHEAGG